jgi:endonuclease/exonuclease/phosphatase family metal-dependent hydrolase
VLDGAHLPPVAFRHRHSESADAMENDLSALRKCATWRRLKSKSYQLIQGSAGLVLALAFGAAMQSSEAQVLAPVVTTSNVTFRVLAANLTDNSQAYEDPGIRILQAMKPDIVAIQEFNYLTDSTTDIRAFVNTAFGTNFHYYRESGSFQIPNGIISRWPIVQSGSWADVVQSQPNRGFAWARIDLPGTNDLYVVSVHFLSGAGPTARASEATNLKALIQSNFPANAWIVVAGDLNTSSRGETALSTLTTFLSDSPIPTDAVSGGDPDTNNGRTSPYDYVLPNPSLNSNRVSTVVGGTTFPNGLVFDSRVFTPLSSVPPVLYADSGLLQHMAVMKDFRTTVSVTNFVNVFAPVVRTPSPGLLTWNGVSNLTYRVERSANFTNWTQIGTAFSATTNYAFTNAPGTSNQWFYRVIYP